MPSIFNVNKSFTQADGEVEVVTPSYDDSCTQVSFKTDSTTGTLAVYAKYHPDADKEPILEEDGTTPLVVNLASDNHTFQLFDKWVYSFVFVPTSVNNTYTPLVASGEIYRTRLA